MTTFILGLLAGIAVTLIWMALFSFDDEDYEP